MTGILSIDGIQAIISEDGWQSENEGLANLLNVLYPYPNAQASAGEYDPNPMQTVLEAAAKGENGEIIQDSVIERKEGVIY